MVKLPDRVRSSLQRRFEFCKATELENLFELHLKEKEYCKEQTCSNYRTWYKHLNAFFGNRELSTITRDDAERFKAWCLCISSMSESTVSRGLRACGSIFQFGQESGLLSRNPFVRVRSKGESDEGRIFYVDRMLFCRLLSACRDDRERLVLALARFAGFRVPSELCNLRFCDFTDKVIRIHPLTKTGFREVPLLAEIREIFARLSGDPEDLVLPGRYSSKDGPTRILKRGLSRLDIPCWPKLFINLRSSCITDFETIGYTEKSLDSMFGNSARVRRRYYIQFRKESEYRRILDDDKRLYEYLRYRSDEDIVTELEPMDIREFILAQRIATTSVLR